MIRAIAACDDKLGIGKNGTLPWGKNKSDLAWFKFMTQDQTVVMGHNTWIDSAMPKPLPKRYNIVVADKDFKIDEPQPNAYIRRDSVVSVITSFTRDVWIIGGAKLYEQTWDIIDELYLTRIHGDYLCDKHIPSLSIFSTKEAMMLPNNLHIEKYTK